MADDLSTSTTHGDRLAAYRVRAGRRGGPGGQYWVATLVLFAVFLALAAVGRDGPVQGEQRLDVLLEQRAPARLVWLSRLAGAPVWDPLVICLAGVLWWRGQRQTAVTLAAGLIGTEILATIAKDVINRQPPGAADIELLWRAPFVLFPSAHVVRATVTLGMLVARLPWGRRSRQLAALAASCAFLTLLGLTQASVGGHLPLDVLGGYCFGGACLGIILLLANAAQHRWAGRSERVC